MKQIYKILSMAALVFAGALTSGCADQFEEPLQPQEGGNTVTLTATVGFDASTKALTAAGVKTFAADETIAVFYTNESSNLVKTTYTFTAGDLIDGGRRATITVSMTDPKAGGAMKYIYPASMAKDDGSVNYNALKSQNGTLATIATKYDLAVYEGTLTGDAALPSGVTLSNQLAILELTVKNAGSSVNGSVTKLSVFDGTNVYKISRSAVAGPIYVAMRPVSNDKTIHFCAATDNKKIYRKSVSDKTLDRNNIYPVNLTTTETTGTALEFLTTDFEAQNGDILSGILLGSYKISTASTGINDPAITVWLDGVDINNSYAIAPGAPGINCKGNTNLVLAAGSVNHVTACTNIYGYAGIYIKNDMTLTISGSGSLTATGKGDISNYYGGAGIGSSFRDNGGNVVITGGTITATGGFGAAGIGGCAYGRQNRTCGNISISGGNVTATGGFWGAGIGSGMVYPERDEGFNQCGNINITGGTITATGGSYAAGIGGGYAQNGAHADGHVICGTITITSGVTRVAATKGYDSIDSIGRGEKTRATQKCGTITIGCTLDGDGKPVGGTVYWDGSSYKNGGDTYLTTSPLVYEPQP